MNLQGLGDQQLMNYIEQIFVRYDRDRSGSLDVAELGNFYVDLYRSLGYHVQISYQQAAQAMAQIDKNYDGRASRQELFQAFRYMLSNSNTYLTNMQPIQGYQYQQYVPQQQMYGQQPYMQQQMYTQQPQVYGQQPNQTITQQVYYSQQQQLQQQQQQQQNTYGQQPYNGQQGRFY